MGLNIIALFIFMERKTCIFCRDANLKPILGEGYTIPLGCYVVADPAHVCQSMPFNILECKSCHTFQTQYLGDPNIIYDYNANAFGTIRSTMNEKFADFIQSGLGEKNQTHSLLEIGGGNGALSELVMERLSECSYTVVDPTYSGIETGRTIYRQFFETLVPEKIKAEALIMSHVFEHFYEPLNIMETLKKCSALKQVYLNFPDLESYIRMDNYHVLNPEHIFYVENEFIIRLFEKFGFKFVKMDYHEKHSVFFEFERYTEADNMFVSLPLLNRYAHWDVPAYINRIFKRIDAIYEALKQSPGATFYIWPCSMHTTYLIAFGLDERMVKAVLDNAPHKIGKYLYGSKKKCIALQEVLESPEEAIILLNGGCYNAEITNLSYPNKKFI